jgi:Na+/proline symporter
VLIPEKEYLMSGIDYGIVIAYLIGMIAVGLYFQRKASEGINSYFLGKRGIPWWALGASGMSSNLDISGTMINTAFIFALGASGFFIEIRGGVTLIMAFLMIFQGKWNRRALVMTLAEWMHFRFGRGKQGDIARLIAAFSIIIMTIAMVTYFAVGSGKFVAEFLGIPSFWGFSSQFWAATLMIVLAMIYTVASGLYGVVWTDVFQGILIFGTIISICALSFFYFNLPETFQVSVPLREGGFMALETTRDAWTSMIPNWTLDLPEASAYSIYNLFGIAILFYLIKVTIEGAGGTSQYMIQRFFASRSDRESGLLSLFWTVLLAFRWPFIAAIAIMGIVLGTTEGVIKDPETVLPVVINQLVPIGLKGILVAGLMAAAMSTFDSTVNAGAAYWVKDIYQTYLNPAATEKQLMRHSRWSSVIIVILGLGFMLVINNINEIWGYITSSLGAGLLIPTLTRWYWWRMNGNGFALGTAFGLIAAVLQRIFLPDIPEYYAFIIATVSSLVGMLIGTYSSKPTEDSVLFEFYKRTRPFGFWGPVRKKLGTEVIEKINTENRRDILSTFFAVPWQVILFLTGMAFIMKSWTQFGVLVIILAILSIGLYFNWFRHLSTEVKVD